MEDIDRINLSKLALAAEFIVKSYGNEVTHPSLVKYYDAPFDIEITYHGTSGLEVVVRKEVAGVYGGQGFYDQVLSEKVSMALKPHLIKARMGLMKP